MIQVSKNKEQAILDAAEHEFLEKGFDQARTTSIATAAGVTHGMLHYYFRTKENIFERILDEKMRMMGHSILEAFGDREQPLMERLKRGISTHFDFLAENPDLPRFIINEIVSKPERYALMHERMLFVIDRIVLFTQQELDDLAAQGETEPIDIRQLMLDVLSLNIFIFLGYPVFAPLLVPDGDRERFLRARKEEHIEIIMRRLKKQ